MTSVIAREQQGRVPAFDQLRSSPRLLVLMGAMLPAAIAIGSLGVARVLFGTEAFGSELGIGFLAWIAGGVGAALAIPAGFVADRFDSRTVLVCATIMLGAGNLVLGIFLTIDGVQWWELIAAVSVDAAALAIVPGGMARLQAALVPVTARGAADVINLFRLSIGGVIGSVITLWISGPAIIVTASGLIFLATSIAIWMIAKPVPGSRAEHSARSEAEGTTRPSLRGALLSDRGLRALIMTDLALFFVIPTQFVNLLLVDRGIVASAGTVIAAGMLGVLIGRGWPAFIGQPKRMQVAVLSTTVGFTIVSVIGGLLMIDDWILRQVVLFLSILTLGAALAAYVQCVLAAAIQQRSPDDIRGRLSGTLWALRLLLVSVSVAGSAWLIDHYDVRIYLAVLAGMLVIAIGAFRGFRDLRH